MDTKSAAFFGWQKKEVPPTQHSPHNQAGRTTEVSVAGVQNTSYQYDDLLRERTYTDPRGKTQASHSDSLGRVASVVQRNGQTIEYAYDAKNRVEFEYWKNGLQTVATLGFTYFPVGNAKQEIYSGNLANPLLGHSSRQVYDYDVLGRLDDVFSFATDRATVVTDYDFDANGNREWLSSRINRSVKYSHATDYDGLNRPSKNQDNQKNKYLFALNDRHHCSHSVTFGYNMIDIVRTISFGGLTCRNQSKRPSTIEKS